jgi:hypothetical protein
LQAVVRFAGASGNQAANTDREMISGRFGYAFWRVLRGFFATSAMPNRHALPIAAAMSRFVT